MKTKDYSQCSSSLDFVTRVMQNAINTLLSREHLIPSLEQGHYIYHSTLTHSLSEEASPQQVFHAFLEINRYCFERNDCRGILIQYFVTELSNAMAVHALNIHNIERQKHGRSFIH